ncbi:MAG: hypothetical protein WCA45_08745 [Thiobacillaceae bacterium]
MRRKEHVVATWVVAARSGHADNCSHVPSAYHSKQRRQDARLLAAGPFDTPRSQGRAGDGGTTWRTSAGLGHSPRTILEELSRITAADIVLPLADESRRELRIRCVVRLGREQQILLDHLGLQLPQRLKAPPVSQM